MGEINLPKGWAITKLELLTTDISYGYTAPSSYDEVGPKMLRITDIQDNSVVWSDVPYCEIEEERLEKYLLKKNDLVFARTGATVGKSFLIRTEPPKAVYASYLIRVRTASEELISVLSHFFKSQQYWQQITEFSSGIGQPNVNGTKLKGLTIPLPPLAEQKIIADKLDTMLAQVEATKAHLERIPGIIKTFRQSVLSAAVSGKLTEEWRDKNHFIPAYPDKGKEKFKSDLFDSATQSLPELPKEWGVVPAANILEYVTSGSRGWANYYADGGALFLRMSNVRYDTTKLDLNDLQYVNLPESVEGKRSLVRKNDLVISITADVGRVARIDMELDEAYVNQHLALVRPSKHINSEYLATCIAAVNIGVKQVQALKRGATKAGLGLDDIRSLAIPFPSIEEQDEIVRCIEVLCTFADRVEIKATAALDRVNKISQSILAKAFRGELTADWRAANPDLISGGNSAKALLEKIKAEREAVKRQPKAIRPAVKKSAGSRMSKQIIKVVEALKQAGEPLSGQQLLAAAGYPNDSSTEQLEQFFLDIRDALTIEESIVKLERGGDSQDWFAINKAKN
jgi:type I restriction enzyme S subunit